MSKSQKDADPFIRIAPYHYVHVINLNTHVTRLVLGPQSYICLQDEKVVFGPEKMISLPPMKYCVIRNPVIRTSTGETVVDKYGQVTLNFGDLEYRFAQKPFPLYPGEQLLEDVQSLPIVPANSALRLRALVNFTNEEGVSCIAGEEWLYEGPATYFPRKEVEVIGTESSQKITPNTALCLRAMKDCVDRSGVSRVCGEMWLVSTPGVYLPGAYEEVVERRTAHKLTDKTALHMRALEAHMDKFGKSRRYGEEYLITRDDADSHICSVQEEVVDVIPITVLNAHQYCIILDPVDQNGFPQLGKKQLIRGEKSFFLKPGEDLQSGVQNSYILQSDEGLILCAEEAFNDDVHIGTVGLVDDAPPTQRRKISRVPGDQWMIRGPMEYVPPIEVKVVTRRKLIPLDRNEGVYVRNTQTGEVRTIIGQAYMLNQNEELWEKNLPPDVIQMLKENKDPLADRGMHRGRSGESAGELDLKRVVTFQVPHNAAVQIYDYKDKSARVEFGPNLVMLGPDEQFTKLSLSGGKPKRPNQIKSLCLLLGPDFCTDVIVVETADHARLSLQLSYNWHFEVPEDRNQKDAARLFSVPDFVGDACKAIASRIRGSVAGVKFDDFHKHSARLIRSSVFGLDDNKKVRDELVFPQNNLHITSIDVQSVEPVDQRTRDALQKSVQLAIEITTNSQEAAARHEAERLEQEARARLERQKIEGEAEAEEARRGLIEARVQLGILESTGQAKAEAQGRAESARIEGEERVKQAKLRAEALAIETDAELERLRKARELELKYLTEKDTQSLKTKAEQAEIDVSRFTAMINAFGTETIRSIATASSDHNLRMLSALGLQSTLITDGTTPVNLLSTAHGLIGQLMPSNDSKGDRVGRSIPKHMDRTGQLLPEDAGDDDAESTVA